MNIELCDTKAFAKDIELEVEREEFERWFVATQTLKNYGRVAKSINGTYLDSLARVAWRAWRAALKRKAI